MLSINGEIDDFMASFLIKKLLEITNNNPEETITICISSEGGKVTSGMAIYDVISFIPNPINTIAKGKVGGIATLILAAGTPGMRYAYRDSSISLGNFWIKKDTKSIPPEIETTIQKIYNIIAKHTQMRIEKIMEIAHSELYFDADQAILYGLVDNIYKDYI